MEKKFRTKNQRHAYDDEKRRQSLLKKLKDKQSQKELIKKALTDGNPTRARKVVFSDDIVKEVPDIINGNDCQVVSNKDSMGKLNLFDESDSDKDENYEIKIKSQFEGKKGHKLLSLQSTYNNDERFRLDERFKDGDSSDEGKEDSASCERICNSNGIEPGLKDINEEKTKQFKVLETVLGGPIQSTSETERKPRKSFFDMVRFDASNEDHKRQQNNVGNKMEEGTVKKKKKLNREERKRRRKEEEEKKGGDIESNTCQNKEKKFYEVSDDLKAALKNRHTENGQFSLLAAFSKKKENDNCEEGEEEEAATEGGEKEFQVLDQVWHENDDKQEKSIPVSHESTNKEPKEVRKVQGISKEMFFLTPNDPRIEEALTFINMKNSEEAGKAIENYDETRRGIRVVLRLRWQKYRQRNNPFKKKIGGSNKKKMPLTNNRKQFGKTVTYRKR